MNNMQMLIKLTRILEEEQQMQLEIERLETVAKGLGSAAGDTGRRVAQKDKMERAEINLLLEKDKQAYKRREFYIFRQQALEVFWSLPDHATSYVLDLYYVRGMSTRQIAEHIGMSKSWVANKKLEGERRLTR